MAPMYKLGAKIPPALPDAYDTIVAASFSTQSAAMVLNSCPPLSRLIDVLVSDAHDGWPVHQPDTDDQSSHGGLDDPRRLRQSKKQAAKPQKPFTEQQRHHAAENPERRISEELRGMHEMGGGHMKQRFVAQNGAFDDHRRDGRDDRRSEECGIHIANDFLQRKQDRGDRCLEGCGERTCGPTGTRSRTRRGDRCSHWPTSDARPAPIWTDGPSRPIEWPEPMHSTPVMTLPNGTRPRMMPLDRWYAASV